MIVVNGTLFLIGAVELRGVESAEEQAEKRRLLALLGE